MTSLPERQHAVNPRETRTPAGDAFSGLAIRVLRLAALLTAAGDELAAGAAGQTTARWQVLAAVEDGPRSVSEVARLLGLARQSVQRVTDALEAGGLVAYEDNPRHRRAKLVSLTAAGSSALAAIQAAQRPWADGLGAQLGTEDVRRATAILDRVLGAMTARRPPGGNGQG